MATAVTCDMCQQEQAQTMQTNVNNGDVLAVGANCLLIFHLTVAAEMIEQLPEENRLAYAEVVRPIVDRLAAAAPPPAPVEPVPASPDTAVPPAADVEPTPADG